MDNSGVFALIQQLSDADRAQIGLAVLEYTLTGTTTQQMPPILSLAFEKIKEFLPTKDNRGGVRPGAGRPKNQNKIKINQKKSKNGFDYFDFCSGDNGAENQEKSADTTVIKTATDSNSIPPTPPLHHSTTNNCNNINNNISITRARESSKTTPPDTDLFSAPAAAPKKQSRFTPPTVEMVAEYCRERKNGIDAQHFVDHYTMRGWIPKGATRQMTDWRAAIRTWERSGYNKNSPPCQHVNRTTQNNNNPFASLD